MRERGMLRDNFFFLINLEWDIKALNNNHYMECFQAKLQEEDKRHRYKAFVVD
jgi:5-methylthioribose kinase